MTERQAVQKMVQPCLTALADLHAKGIAHGAVLPQNILHSSQESTCKLAGVWLTALTISLQFPSTFHISSIAHGSDMLLQLYMLSSCPHWICFSFVQNFCQQSVMLRSMICLW